MCTQLANILGEACKVYGGNNLPDSVVLGNALCTALSSAIALTGVGTVTAGPIFAACEAFNGGFAIYCSTLGAGPTDGAPNLADKLCSAELVNFSIYEDLVIYATVDGVNSNIISNITTNPGQGPYEDLVIDLGNDGTDCLGPPDRISPVSITSFYSLPGAMVGPMRVQVTDKKGNKLHNARVIWNSSGYTEDENSIETFTNSEGIAEISLPSKNTEICTEGSYKAIIPDAQGISGRHSTSFYYGNGGAAITQATGNNIGGPNGIPMSGSVTISIAGWSHTWSIYNDATSSSNTDFVSMDLPSSIYEQLENGDIDGTITASFNRRCYVSVGVCYKGPGKFVNYPQVLTEYDEPNQTRTITLKKY